MSNLSAVSWGCRSEYDDVIEEDVVALGPGVDPPRDGSALYTGKAGVDDLDMIASSSGTGWLRLTIVSWRFSAVINWGCRILQYGQLTAEPCNFETFLLNEN